MSEQVSTQSTPTLLPPTLPTPKAPEPLQATGSPPAASKADVSKATSPEQDLLRELLDRMQRFQPLISGADPKLANTLQELSRRGSDPDIRAQPGFRTDVAYALQDLEKFHVGRIELPSSLRAEMAHLAGTAVGLTNDRMQGLVVATANLQERPLIAEIRSAAKGLGQRVDQNGPEVESRIDVLENKIRLADRPVIGPVQPEPNAPAPSIPPSPPRDAGPGDRIQREFAPSFQPGDSGLGGGNKSAPVKTSALDTILRAMRPDGKQEQAPWEPPATPMADRLASFAQTQQRRDDDSAFARLETGGRAALEALQGFTSKEGAAVMGRIEAAAKTEPGGMAQVLSEMKAGGRFEGLRQEFTGALAADKGFAAAYETASGALAAYGKRRTDVEAIVSRRPDATAFTGRLERLDAEIGTAASNTPSKTEGNSLIEDLSKRVAELLNRAVEAVKATFNRLPTPSAGPSNSPGP